MMKRFGLTAAALGLGLLLAACGDPSKADILKKAENISTKAELESKLGRPDEISKLGPVEQWIYKAKDGSVLFVITGDSVALQATGGKRE
ncbi:hypothetical protein [Oceanibaculum nanhaiense]|jgi:hypothetical protein|uniref:hypothetical protein n=2 Tax=Oceanibaculum nanhaiense TaxID=1909734 RepID=UPI000A3609B1|nr:hypothetical protein [Oceanibaculum nanhaiense]MBC7134128.1 hypothetical protein [Oceanibaculum nanhaiense]